MPLRTKTESLKALQEQKRAERVHARADVSQHLASDLAGKRNGPKDLAEVHAMVALGGPVDIGKLARFGPVKLACRLC